MIEHLDVFRRLNKQLAANNAILRAVRTAALGSPRLAFVGLHAQQQFSYD
jgi:hypothetical protein